MILFLQLKLGNFINVIQLTICMQHIHAEQWRRICGVWGHESCKSGEGEVYIIWKDDGDTK